MADDPREALLTVARDIIDKRGYLGLSLRTVSAAAGVTPEVARRYYRNRDQLFAAALRLPVDPTSAIPTLVAPGLEGMGERLVRFTLDLLRDPQARNEIISLVRTGATAGHAVFGLQDFLERGVVDRVAGMIGVPDARMRSALITSYLLGIAMTRYGVRLEPLASASEEEVIRMVAPVIQDLLDPRKPIPGSTRARTRVVAPSGVVHAPTGAPMRTFDPDPKATAAAAAAAAAGLMAARGSGTPSGRPPATPAGEPSKAGTRTRTGTPRPSGSAPARPASAAKSGSPRSAAATPGPAARSGSRQPARPESEAPRPRRGAASPPGSTTSRSGSRSSTGSTSSRSASRQPTRPESDAPRPRRAAAARSEADAPGSVKSAASGPQATAPEPTAALPADPGSSPEPQEVAAPEHPATTPGEAGAQEPRPPAE